MNSTTVMPVLDQLFGHGGKGPVTAGLQRRFRLTYWSLVVLGLVPLFLHMSAGWQAFGIGLWFPGAGFLAAGGWATLLFPVALLLFLVSLVAWLGAGMLLAPLVIWLGSAALAGGLAGSAVWSPGIYLAAAVVVAWNVYVRRKIAQRAIKRQELRAKRQAYLPAKLAELDEVLVPVPPAGSRELNAEQMAALRYCIDRALQPAGDWTHYDRIDQFQPAALRYQLNSLGYTIGVAQCHYTPNFHGYMSEAQRGLIEKYLRREIWSYWRLERLWGSVTTEFDPAGTDNIMLSGFYGINLGLYEGNTGDKRYSQPGSLTFRWNEKLAFPHDFHSITRSIVDNMQRNDLCLYPCEPNWVYTPCNFRGLTTMAVHDRVAGTHYLQDVLPRFMDKLNTEFTQIDGSILTVMSNHIGFAVPVGFGEGNRAMMMNAFKPDHARVAWALARAESVRQIDGKLEVILQGKGVDFGNYRQSHFANLAGLMNAAGEMGDVEVAAAAKAKLDELYPSKIEDGAAFYPASNFARAMLAQALIAGRDDWRNAIIAGPAPAAFTGPLLAAAPYPEVLVAKAFSTGDDLELVLLPGREGGRFTLTLERLVPGGVYVLVQDGRSLPSLNADSSGRAALEVEVIARTHLAMKPENQHTTRSPINANLLPGARCSSALIQRAVSHSASRSMPVLMPRPCSM